jgi:hypothetical protein
MKPTCPFNQQQNIQRLSTSRSRAGCPFGTRLGSQLFLAALRRQLHPEGLHRHACTLSCLKILLLSQSMS